jgi:hypothetical protein
MTENKYNGWSNYATWRINLEVFDGWDIRENFENPPSISEVSGMLEETLNELLEMESSGLALNYAMAFVSDVNFHEIAEKLIDAAEYDKYSVLVGNIGEVYEGYSEDEAEDAYLEYVAQSQAGYGRASGECVRMFVNGEPTKEHESTQEGAEQ